MSAALRKDGSPVALRNRALIVICFCTALRGINLAALRMDDVERSAAGLIVHVRREKQDQIGKGRYIGLPHGQNADTCPVRCFESWAARRGDKEGAVFHSFAPFNLAAHLVPERISLIVKKCLALIGVDPTRYGSHSMRAGFVTAAGEAGAGELLIASQTGHRDMTVLRRYFRKTKPLPRQCVLRARFVIGQVSLKRPRH